jgi:predicted DsbA family dithiol-disulfide isomerase
VQIALWSDFACPWCALGLYRLEAALAQFEHGDAVTVRHRAFELDPRAPAQRSLGMAEAVAKKYGFSAERVQAGHAQLTALGSEVGLTFAFDRVQLGNTFAAHRLARSSHGSGHEDALVKGLFAAHFTEGRLLSDPDVLLDVAQVAGLEPDQAQQVIESDAFADEVRADEVAAQELDVTGVPFFLINGAWPIPGAQDVETMLLILRRAWERTEVLANDAPP